MTTRAITFKNILCTRECPILFWVNDPSWFNKLKKKRREHLFYFTIDHENDPIISWCIAIKTMTSSEKKWRIMTLIKYVIMISYFLYTFKPSNKFKEPIYQCTIILPTCFVMLKRVISFCADSQIRSLVFTIMIF